MAKRGLKARDIEKLENTSIAQALGAGGANPVAGEENTFSFGSCDTCGDTCGCPATNGCPTTGDSCGCPSGTCPSVVCDNVSVNSTACCDALVEDLRATFERLTEVEARNDAQ